MLAASFNVSGFVSRLTRRFCFAVTEKVWESDSTDASDNEVQITEPQTTKEKQPSPAKKPSKRIHTDMKNKGTKQASLTSFFKKT